MECKQYKEQLEKCTIESSVSGKVSDITIYQELMEKRGRFYDLAIRQM